MKIVFLDAKTLGDDIDYTPFEQLGEVVKYPFSTPEEIAGRAKDADVLVVNKVQINARTIPFPEKLKLVCVTATGTNNLDKEYLAKWNIQWRNVAGYSTESVAQHTFAVLFYLMEHLRYYDDYVKDGHYINDLYPFFQNLPRTERICLGHSGSWRHRPQSGRYRRNVRRRCDLLLSIGRSRTGRISSGGF